MVTRSHPTLICSYSFTENYVFKVRIEIISAYKTPATNYIKKHLVVKYEI